LPGIVAHVCNSSVREVEARGLEFEANLGNIVSSQLACMT
jgi:hypothetical protein